MVSSREVCLFWTKNTAFSAECKEKDSVFLLLPLAGSPSQALTRQIPPFVTYGDIFPRSGGSLSSKGEPLAVHANFISLPRPLPLGEVDLRSKDGEGEDAIRCAPSKKGTPERPQVFRCSKV